MLVFRGDPLRRPIKLSDGDTKRRVKLLLCVCELRLNLTNL
jgi:hypothetical protein